VLDSCGFTGEGSVVESSSRSSPLAVASMVPPPRRPRGSLRVSSIHAGRSTTLAKTNIDIFGATALGFSLLAEPCIDVYDTVVSPHLRPFDG
jgi:hypothetical protein